MISVLLVLLLPLIELLFVCVGFVSRTNAWYAIIIQVESVNTELAAAAEDWMVSSLSRLFGSGQFHPTDGDDY